MNDTTDYPKCFYGKSTGNINFYRRSPSRVREQVKVETLLQVPSQILLEETQGHHENLQYEEPVS
jgi:hypothetical protein